MQGDERGPYYRHSGRAPIGGLALSGAVGLATGLVGGFVYGVLTWLNPFVYISFLLTLLLGGAVGFTVGWAAKAGRVRSGPIVLACGLLFGLVALYAGWMGWFLGLSGWEGLVVSPAAMLWLMSAMAEEGVWSIFGWTPMGWALYLIWLAEAGMIVAVAGVVARSRIATLPFCERCARWVEEAVSLPLLKSPGDTAGLRAALESGDVAKLLEIDLAGESDTSFTRVTIRRCDGCDAMHLLTAKAVEVTLDRQGQRQQQETAIAENLLIDGQTYRTLASMEEEMTLAGDREQKEQGAAEHQSETGAG